VDISGPAPHQQPESPVPGPASPGYDGTASEGSEVGQPGPAAGSAPGHLVRNLAVYTVLRVALVAVLTLALSFFMPLIVALLFAIIAQLPLAWLLFAGPRRRVNEAIAQASAQRRAERARLQSALSGDVEPS
jgi:hypothetical protein